MAGPSQAAEDDRFAASNVRACRGKRQRREQGGRHPHSARGAELVEAAWPKCRAVARFRGCPALSRGWCRFSTTGLQIDSGPRSARKTARHSMPAPPKTLSCASN